MPAVSRQALIRETAGMTKRKWTSSRLALNSMIKQPAVYILASRKNGTLYVGVTSDLVKRIWEHRNDVVEGFTNRYGVHQLVWYEIHESMDSAIQREKRLKEWKRKWKVQLIENRNPNWEDLYPRII
jgi:putative endonuclease